MSDHISQILFPEIEPYNHELFVTNSIHSIYFEECGNPDGVPVSHKAKYRKTPLMT